MKIKDMLFRSAGKELGFYGSTKLQPQEAFKLEALAADYGKSVVDTDFIAWCEEARGADYSYPVTVYLKVADGRLKALAAAPGQVFSRDQLLGGYSRCVSGFRRAAG